MAQFTKERDTSTTFSSLSGFSHNCAECPRVAAIESGTTLPPEIQTANLLKICVEDLGNLRKDIIRVEKEQDKTRHFYDSATKLGKISRIVILILMAIPVIQIIACAVVVYHLGIQERLPGLLVWGLGSISVLSFVEVVLMPVKFYTMEKRLDDIDGKLNK